MVRFFNGKSKSFAVRRPLVLTLRVARLPFGKFKTCFYTGLFYCIEQNVSKTFEIVESILESSRLVPPEMILKCE